MRFKRIGRIELRQERQRRNKMAAAVPRVSVQPDRVTFTVQHEIEISYADPPRAAASESEWLRTFTKIIEARESRGWGRSEVPAPQIQALYHSSALPVPIGNAGMEHQSVTNGLVSACLFSFAKVRPRQKPARFCPHFIHECAAAQAPGAPPRRHLPSSAGRSRHSRVPKRRGVAQRVCVAPRPEGARRHHPKFVCSLLDCSPCLSSATSLAHLVQLQT